MRRSFAQSTAISTRSPRSIGSSRCTSLRSRKPYSAGVGALPERYITTFLPRSRRPSATPSIEPSASPSGFSCVTTRKRSCARIASATARTPALVSLLCIGLILGKVRRQIIDQLRHPYAALDGIIVRERQHRRPAQAELPTELRLQDTARGLEARERRGALLVVAENGDEDPRLSKVGRDMHAGHGDH